MNRPTQPQPLLLQAAISLETTAKLIGLEAQLLPLAEHLRAIDEMAKNPLIEHELKRWLESRVDDSVVFERLSGLLEMLGK